MRIDYVDFVIREGSLFRATKLCIPRTSLRDFLVWEMHAGGLAGHYGRDFTIALVEDRFDWPSLSLKKDVSRIVSQCRTCQLAKAKKNNTALYTPLLIPHTPWRDVSMNATHLALLCLGVALEVRKPTLLLIFSFVSPLRGAAPRLTSSFIALREKALPLALTSLLAL